MKKRQGFVGSSGTLFSERTVIEVLGLHLAHVDEAISLIKSELKRLILADDWSNSALREWITSLSKDQVLFAFMDRF